MDPPFFRSKSGPILRRMLALGKLVEDAVAGPAWLAHANFRRIVRADDPLLKILEVFAQSGLRASGGRRRFRYAREQCRALRVAEPCEAGAEFAACLRVHGFERSKKSALMLLAFNTEQQIHEWADLRCRGTGKDCLRERDECGCLSHVQEEPLGWAGYRGFHGETGWNRRRIAQRASVNRVRRVRRRPNETGGSACCQTAHGFSSAEFARLHHSRGLRVTANRNASRAASYHL